MALTVAAGQILTADMLNAPLPLYVVKSALQTVTSSVAVVNDTELFLDLAAGRTYEVTAMIACSGAAAGDIRIAWATTGTIAASSTRAMIGPPSAATDVTATTLRDTAAVALASEIVYGVDSTGLIGQIQERFIVVVSVAGRLTLRWAQGTASATATNVWNTSSLIARPLS